MCVDNALILCWIPFVDDLLIFMFHNENELQFLFSHDQHNLSSMVSCVRVVISSRCVL